MDLNTKKPNTEAEALQNIAAWSRERPLWQRDALRRLCNKATLSENDFDELIAIAKGNEDGVQPLNHEDFPSSQSAYQTVNLKFIKNIEHVNALVQGQCLSFNKAQCQGSCDQPPQGQLMPSTTPIPLPVLSRHL